MRVQYLFLVALLLAVTPAFAQPTPRVAAKPPLTHVTVYINGTALEHKGTVALVAGLNRVAVSGLSPDLEIDKLEVQLGSGAELLAVDENEPGDEPDDAQNEEPPAGKLPPANRRPGATDSLRRAEAAQRTAEAELAGLADEQKFLLANQTIPAGIQANWSAEVQRGATLMRTRLAAIRQETARLNELLITLLTQIGQLQQPSSSRRGEHVLLVRASHAGTVPLALRYYLPTRPNWLPQLDIRANAAGDQVQFVTSGRFSNRSGLDWRRVPVTLMRYVVGEQVARPTLVPWELDFNNNGSNGEGRVDAFVVKGTAKGQPATVQQGSRYDLPEPLTLANHERHSLRLPPVTLPARAEYLAVPRSSEQVVLQTKVSGWQGLQLPEKARIYQNGAYVGTTDLDPTAYNDSLAVVLGTEPQVLVGRAKLEDFSGDVPLSSKRRVRLTYELNVQNRRAEAVRLRLLDEVPISQEKEIEVKILEASGAQHDERTGQLTWLLTVPPGSSQRLRFSFQVDYPKDKTVEIINHRMRISNPKFR